MASIKIHTKDVSLFFSNDLGDGYNEVRILGTKDKVTEKAEFIGHFTVKTKAWLSAYDCDDSKIHEFKKGRYFVWRINNCVQEIPVCAVFEIKKQDEDIHA